MRTSPHARMEITGGRGFDKIVDAVGPAEAQPSAFALLSPTGGGLACVAGRPST